MKSYTMQLRESILTSHYRWNIGYNDKQEKVFNKITRRRINSMGGNRNHNNTICKYIYEMTKQINYSIEYYDDYDEDDNEDSSYTIYTDPNSSIELRNMFEQFIGLPRHIDETYEGLYYMSYHLNDYQEPNTVTDIMLSLMRFIKNKEKGITL